MPSNASIEYPPVAFHFAQMTHQFGPDYHHFGAFWFSVAQLRSLYDSMRVLDGTSAEAVHKLSLVYGEDIRPYLFKDNETLEKYTAMAIDFVENNEETYDPGWIASFGEDALKNSGMRSKDQISKPKELWPDLKKQAIGLFFEGKMAALKAKFGEN